MIIHISLLIFVSVLGFAVFFNRRSSEKKNRWFLFCSFLVVFLIQVLRSDTVGIDTPRYSYAFNQVVQGNFARYIIDYWEPMYRIINRVVARFSDNFQWIFVICSLIIDLGVFYFIDKNTDSDKAAFWPVFFWITFSTYLNTMNVVRQSMAIAFTLNIFTVLCNKNDRLRLIKAVILLGLAASCHTASLVCVVFLIPFFARKIDRKFIVILSVIGLIAFILTNRIINLFFTILPGYSKYVDSPLFEGSGGIGGYYILIMLVKLILITLVFMLEPTEENQKLYILSFYMLLSILLYLIKTKVGLASRIAYYLDCFIIIFIPLVLQRIRNRKPLYYTIAYVFGWIMFVYLLSTPEGSRGCVPYTFFWQ